MMPLPREDGDYPLWLLLATKEKLFRVTEDPTLEDARAILTAIDAVLDLRRSAQNSGMRFSEFHDEARQLAILKQDESNLARCYLDLVDQLNERKLELANVTRTAWEWERKARERWAMRKELEAAIGLSDRETYDETTFDQAVARIRETQVALRDLVAAVKNGDAVSGSEAVGRAEDALHAIDPPNSLDELAKLDESIGLDP